MKETEAIASSSKARKDQNFEVKLGVDSEGREIYMFGSSKVSYCRIVFKGVLSFGSKEQRQRRRDIMSELLGQRQIKSESIIREIQIVAMGYDISIIQEKYERNLEGMDYSKLSYHKKLRILENITRGLEDMRNKNFVHTHLSPFWIVVCSESDKDITTKFLLHQNSFSIKDVKDLKKPRNEICAEKDPYTSPEASQNKIYDPAGDIWSLGVVFYELIFGKIGKSKNYKGHFKPTFPMECPNWLQSIIEQMLDEDPKRRPTPKRIFEFLKPAFTCSQIACESVDKLMRVEPSERKRRSSVSQK